MYFSHCNAYLFIAGLPTFSSVPPCSRLSQSWQSCRSLCAALAVQRTQLAFHGLRTSETGNGNIRKTVGSWGGEPQSVRTYWTLSSVPPKGVVKTCFKQNQGKRFGWGCSGLGEVGWKVEAMVPPFTPQQIAHALSVPLLPRQNHPCKVDWGINTDWETSAFIAHLSWMLEGTPRPSGFRLFWEKVGALFVPFIEAVAARKTQKMRIPWDRKILIWPLADCHLEKEGGVLHFQGHLVFYPNTT